MAIQSKLNWKEKSKTTYLNGDTIVILEAKQLNETNLSAFIFIFGESDYSGTIEEILFNGKSHFYEFCSDHLNDIKQHMEEVLAEILGPNHWISKLINEE